MKVVEQSIELKKQPINLNDVYLAVEYAARLTHNNTDVHNCEPKEFVHKLIKQSHNAALEFGTIYLKYTPTSQGLFFEEPDGYNHHLLNKYSKNPYSRCRYYGDSYYITTNLRVIHENDWYNDLLLLSECTPHHVQRICVECQTSLQVAMECLRHRSMSFMQHSTRVIKYTDDLSFIKPCFNDMPEKYDRWYTAMKQAEENYFNMRELCSPQEAAQVLPKAFACNLLMCGYKDDWDKFFEQRYYEKTGKVLPEMKQLSTLIYNRIYDRS